MRAAAVAVFLVLVYVAAPWMIAATGRTDLYLHAELRRAAGDRERRGLAHLLHRPDQHRPGRLCARRRLRFGDPGRDLRALVLAEPAARRALLRRRQRPGRPADPETPRRLFRHGHAGPDRGRAARRAGAADHQRRQGHHQHPLAGPDRPLRPHDRAGVRLLRRQEPRLLFPLGHDDGPDLRGALAAGQFARRAAVRSAAAERGPRLLDGPQRAAPARARLCDLVVPRRRRRRDFRRHRPVDLSVELHRQRQRELHAELLPRRARLRVRPDARHARALFRLGPSLPDRRISAAHLLGRDDPVDAAAAERPAQHPAAGRPVEFRLPSKRAG